MGQPLLPPQPPDSGDPEGAIATIPLPELRAAVEQGQVSWEFALFHCPSQHIRYVFGGSTHD